jgi:hypothetical protein
MYKPHLAVIRSPENGTIVTIGQTELLVLQFPNFFPKTADDM